MIKKTKTNLSVAFSAAAILLNSCSGSEPKENNTKIMANTETKKAGHVHDPHSFAEPEKAKIEHLYLDIAVDPDKQVISGTASYDIDNNNAEQIIFDISGLLIEEVKIGSDLKPVDFEIKEGNENGDALVVPIDSNTQKVSIAYTTSTDAAALLWISPEQSMDKKSPFLFTQGQAILTRSWLPIQDSPGIRLTYAAQVKVPSGLMAVMSAENPQEKNSEGVYNFKMEQAIPPYLMALAVGNLSFEAVGDRTGVYAEPGLIKEAAYEFEDMEKMLIAAEKLYGDYEWGRYDVIVLPASFPFGGMENPRLTFATPTIIAGDKSLTSLVAHELAHSWSGNLVTNSTWDDFWLNEGFTVYFEKRIMEEVYGKEYAEMLNELGYQDLLASIEEIGAENADTKLKLDLEGRNPDDGMTDIAYEKGYLFLKQLEETYGRETFDDFLKTYFERNAFTSITTEQFVDYITENLIEGSNKEFNLNEWIYEPGIPADHYVPNSERFNKVEGQLADWQDGKMPAKDLKTSEWTTHEWLHFIRLLPEEVSDSRMNELDEAFGFTNSGNSEIQAAWFEVAIRNDYAKAYPALEKFLVKVGRRKFLKPLYEEMAATEKGTEMAKIIYAKARKNYHSVSAETIDKILDYKG